MRLCTITVVAVAGLSALCASGFCAVPGEVVYWGSIGEKPYTNAENYAPATAEIKVDGTKLFEIRTPGAGYTVAERERVILLRVVEILSNGKISPVFVDKVRGRPTVYVDKVRLVTVYPRDVIAAQAASAQALAESWADGVRAALLRIAPSGAFGGSAIYRVSVGGRLVFRLVDAAGYENVRRRGEEIDRRLGKALANLKMGTIAVTADAHGAVISVNGKPVVTATPKDAKARGYATPLALAEAWVKQITKLADVTAYNEATQTPCCTE